MATRDRKNDQAELLTLDANTLAAAHRVPAIHVGRHTYRGQLLSIEEWLPWWDEWQALAREGRALREPASGVPVDEKAIIALILRQGDFARRYLRVVFPASRYPFWAPDPVAHLLRRPFQMVEETLAFFFILQARATFGAEAIDAVRPPMPAESSPTPGTSSPSKTPAALDVAGPA